MNYQFEKFHFDSHSKTRQILYKCIYSIYLICLLTTSVILIWIIVNLIEGILIERKIRNYIQKSSFEVMSFMEYTKDEFSLTNQTFNINSERILALKGVAFLTNIFSDLSKRLIELEKLFNLWSIIRLITIILIVLFFILCGFVLYVLIKKVHWSHLRTFRYTKLAFILSIIYWVGFILWFTKLIILLPHVAGACSACHDLQGKQVYNSFLYASRWFNSTFLSLMTNKSIDLGQLIEKCQQNSYSWSMNDLIGFGLLVKIDEETYFNQYNLVIKNSSRYERYFCHCQILPELHNNFINLFCHNFVKHLLHYLLSSIVTAISHLLLYLLTILFRRFVQIDKYQFGRLKISMRSLPILARDHSMI